MSRFLSEKFISLNAYTPGEQPSDLEYIKLNTNEAPYPPPPAVCAAVSNTELMKLNLYPNPDGTKLIEKIAKKYDVQPENVIIGNGSDELLAFAFLGFFDDGVAFPDITYGFYPVYASLYDITCRVIPLRDDLTINVNDYTDIEKNIVIANPNAPTGIALKQNEIEDIVSGNPKHLVLIDEAYVDFGADSAIPLTRKYTNLLVVHTYSKARSMAGARLAYAIAAEQIISDMKKMKYSFNPYNVNRLTQALGAAALDNDDYFKTMHSEIIETRQNTEKHLALLGFEMTDSKANFIFVKNPRISGAELYLKLKENGILVRHWNKPRIEEYVRISIGTKEQMGVLVAAVEQILG